MTPLLPYTTCFRSCVAFGKEGGVEIRRNDAFGLQLRISSFVFSAAFALGGQIDARGGRTGYFAFLVEYAWIGLDGFADFQPAIRRNKALAVGATCVLRRLSRDGRALGLGQQHRNSVG